MGMAATTFHTADMVRALPDDGNRYETVHGELLVTPAPQARHQVVVQRLTVALSQYLDGRDIGQVFASPADISWSPDTLVQPDVFVVDLAEARTLEWSRMSHLLLAVEVLSPSSVRADRFTKRRLCQEVRVPAYWAVTPESFRTSMVTVYFPVRPAAGSNSQRISVTVAVMQSQHPLYTTTSPMRFFDCTVLMPSRSMKYPVVVMVGMVLPGSGVS